MKLPPLALAGALLLAHAMLIVVAPALARDDGRYAQSPHKQWFDSLKNQLGSMCCTNADGQRVEDPDWEFNGTSYRVRLNGQWHDVDPRLVVTATNVVGFAVVWPYMDQDKVLIRCFMPGSAG